jgi:hypothetical protein
MGVILHLKGFTRVMALLLSTSASQPWLQPKHVLLLMMEGVGYSFSLRILYKDSFFVCDIVICSTCGILLISLSPLSICSMYYVV